MQVKREAESPCLASSGPLLPVSRRQPAGSSATTVVMVMMVEHALGMLHWPSADARPASVAARASSRYKRVQIDEMMELNPPSDSA